MALTDEERAEMTRKGAVEMSVQDWLGLSDIEMGLIDLHCQLANEVKRRRKAAKMSRKKLAERLNIAQGRITGVEMGVSVSLETLVAAFLAVGGSSAELGEMFAGLAPVAASKVQLAKPKDL